MHQILPRLYLGDLLDAESVTLEQIQCVISLCKEKPHIAEGMAHIYAPIQDEVWHFSSVWSELVYALTDAIRDEPNVLVHCRLGKSRSPALVCAYMATTGWTMASALRHIKRIRPLVLPHPETWRSVMEWSGEVP